MTKDVRRPSAVQCGVAALLIMLVAAPSLAAVGRTQGTFSVGPSGSASYVVPIFTPPGPNGIQPNIALVYNSNGGFGYAGKGWSLAGFSSITRCSKTVGQNGTAVSVRLAWNDGLCLDGNQLRFQSGEGHGLGGSAITYATELADFSRITSNGLVCSGASAKYCGPQYWTVERKDGLIYTYGGTTDSRVTGPYSTKVSQWLVNKIEDRNGNQVVFTWKIPDSTTALMSHPVKVEWTRTSSGSSSYVYRMDFNYEPGGNAPASSYSGFELGSFKKETDLLTSISVSVSGTLSRKYFITYDPSSSTDAKLITSVQECAYSPSQDCLEPTEIQYQETTPGFSSGGTPIAVGGILNGVNGDFDLNGDGVKDLVYWQSGTLYALIGSKTSGYSSPINTGVSSAFHHLAAGKLLNNGADQLLGVSGGYWVVYSWNGTGFSTASTGVSTADTFNDMQVADVDGDGRGDLVYVSEVGSYSEFYPDYKYPRMLIAVRRNQSTGTSPSFAAAQVTDYVMYEANAVLGFTEDDVIPYGLSMEATFSSLRFDRIGDIDGEGRQEIELGYGIDYCIYWGSTPYYCDAVAGSGLTYFEGSTNYAFLLDYVAYVPWFPAGALSLTQRDFNGDGCTDRQMGMDVPFGSYGGVMLSSCMAGFPGREYDYYELSDYTGASNYVGQADVNGDGLKDFILAGAWRALLGNGDLGPVETSFLPSMTSAQQVVVVDANGDRREDIVVVNTSNYLTVHYNTALATPDLATQFKDGFDVEHNVAYTRISDGAYTPYANAPYPLRDVVEGHIVVSSVETTDGAGGTFTTNYTYYGGAKDVARRTFMGFEKVEAVDSRTNIKHVRRFERAFPYAGMMIEESLYQPGGTPISQLTATPGVHTLEWTTNNQRHFPYISATTQDVYEVGGARNGDWLIRTEVSSTINEWGNLTASTRTVTDKDSSSGLYGYSWTTATSASIWADTGYWCLGLPTYTSVTESTTTGEATVQRVKTFTPDYAYCRISADSVQPYTSARTVDTSYGFDTFGNVNSVSVTGRNPAGTSMSVRSSSIGWGTTGQFPVSETNALNESTTRTFHPIFGSLVTETDANGIVVASNEYDTFGRATRSIRADGTATRFTYANCSTYGCENGDPASGATSINKMIVIASERNTSDAQFRDTWTYLDQFDREIVQKTMTASGSYSRSGIQYDGLGRVYRQTVPCIASSCSAYWITNTYDLAGRLLTQSRPQSESNSTAVTTTHAYAGRSQTVTDPQGKNSTKILDVNGWMRHSIDHNGYYQSFGYDGAGSLKQVTDSLSNTLFTANYSYGIRPFQDYTSDMDLGDWSFTHNSLGELVGWSDAKSQSFSQTFDALSRVTSRTEPEGTTTFTFGTSASNHNIGRLASVSMSGFSEYFTYDTAGRPSTQTISTDQNYVIDYAYTNQGLLDTLTYPTSTSSTRVKVKYTYAYGILNAVTDWTSGSAGTVYWTANAQNARGQTTQLTLGNGVVTNRSFDAVTGWLNSIQSGVSGGTGLQNQSYLYDSVGNVTQRQENTLGLTENIYYDNLYRLDYSQLNSVTNLDMAYDAMGNIASKSGVGTYDYVTPQSGCSYYSHTQRHAVRNAGGVVYCYDANGNMIGRAGSTITWASYNYPTSLSDGSESATFYYGPDRQYYRQVYAGSASPTGYEETHYVGGVLEKVFDGTSTDWRHYIKAEGQTVAIVSRSSSGNAVYYPLGDNQGSGSHLTNSSGGGIARQSYAAFGLPRDGNDWDGGVPSGDQAAINAISRRGYTGHSMLGAMGLIHMNGRVQDSITGRFLSADPFVAHPEFTQSYNRYAYVNNNPLSFIDPSGFAPRTEFVCTFEPRTTTAHDFESVPFNERYPDLAFSGSENLYVHIYTGVSRQVPTGDWKKDCWPIIVDDGTSDEAPELSSSDRKALRKLASALKVTSCKFDPNRASQVRADPSSPSNLAPGRYPSKSIAASANIYAGGGLEHRYIADFATRTVHHVSSLNGQVGWKFGASLRWSGGIGNRNFTTVPSGGVEGMGGSGGATGIFGIGISISRGGSGWTTEIGIGFDLGFTGSGGVTDYGYAWPIEDLPPSLSHLGKFYADAFARVCK